MSLFAVSTGVDSFAKPDEIGPLYPFVGAEWLFVVVSVALLLLWHVAQGKGETKENRDAVQMYDEIGLDRAMFHGGSALIATDEEWLEAQRTGTTALGSAARPSPDVEHDLSEPADGPREGP